MSRRCSLRLAVPLWLLLLPSGCQPETRDTGDLARPGALAGANLVVITLDTTRRDHIGAYGDPEARGLTPALDRLAAEGALFLDAYSQTNVTNPSHVAIFTGLYALDARVMNNATRLPAISPEVDTLPAAFRRARYRSAGFPATPHVSDHTLGLPGFQRANRVDADLDAKQVVDQAIAWIDRRTDRPFFAWIHFFDPHAPYRAPVQFQKKFYRGNPRAGDRPPLIEEPSFRRAPPVVLEQFGEVRDRRYPRAMYRAEIHYVDSQIGRLLTHLRARGIWDSTAVVVVGDHGESLGEHQIHYDHAGMFETSLRIPLIVRLPGFPHGARVAETVSHIDLAPTLAHLFGLGLDPGNPRHGVVLVESLLGIPAAIPPRDFVLEDAHNREVVVRRGPWKLIHPTQDRGPSSRASPETPVLLFHLGDDPREQRNLSSRHPERVGELAAVAQRWLDRKLWVARDRPPDRAEQERLEALGYVFLEEAEDETSAAARQ